MAIDAFTLEVLGQLGRVAVVARRPDLPHAAYPSGRVVYSQQDARLYESGGHQWLLAGGFDTPNYSGFDALRVVSETEYAGLTPDNRTVYFIIADA